MKPDELRSMSDDELAQAEANAIEDYFKLRFQHHTGQLTNTAKLKAMRREIARIKTIRRERELAASRGGAS